MPNSSENSHTAAGAPDPVTLDHSTFGAPEEIATEELAARAPVKDENPLFASLGVRAETVAALEAVGITRAFAIQELTLPVALAGNDIIGQARTGTGKTLGFGIPVLERVSSAKEGASGTPQALIVVPTRELCLQVTKDLQTAGATRDIRVLSVYGGRAYEPQTDALRRGVEVVVGTPGRLLDLARQKHLNLSAIAMLVLDEADEMLDLGFLPDVERILAMLPTSKQTMLFSATMPGPVLTMARQFMHKPMHVRAESAEDNQTVPTTQQFVYRAHALDKQELLARVLQARERGRAIVFCRTKRTAQKVSDELAERGFAAAPVHGDLNQDARERALRAFRSGKADVLVATDVAARGIDVAGVTHVVNFQTPDDEKTYLHRIGRTGRAGASGIAITLVDWDEVPKWQAINKILSLPFPDPPETYSTSDHLHEDLDIPTDAASTMATVASEPAESSSRPERRRARRSERPATSEETSRESASRPPRQRRRTRSGQSTVDSPELSASSASRQEPARPVTPQKVETAPAQRTRAPETRTATPYKPLVASSPFVPLFSEPVL